MNPREYEALFKTEDLHWWFVALRREIARAIERYPPGRPHAAARWLDAGSGTGGLRASRIGPGDDSSRSGRVPGRTRVGAQAASPRRCGLGDLIALSG